MAKKGKAKATPSPGTPSKDEMLKWDAEQQVSAAFRETKTFHRAVKQTLADLRKTRRAVKKRVEGKQKK